MASSNYMKPQQLEKSTRAREQATSSKEHKLSTSTTLPTNKYCFQTCLSVPASEEKRKLESIMDAESWFGFWIVWEPSRRTQEKEREESRSVLFDNTFHTSRKYWALVVENGRVRKHSVIILIRERKVNFTSLCWFQLDSFFHSFWLGWVVLLLLLRYAWKVAVVGLAGLDWMVCGCCWIGWNFTSAPLKSACFVVREVELVL